MGHAASARCRSHLASGSVRKRVLSTAALAGALWLIGVALPGQRASLWLATAGAQPVGTSSSRQQEEEAPPPVLVPPKLATYVAATYPEAAAAAGITGTVELEIVIGPDGRVSSAEVATPVSPELDAAALEAGRRLVFVPATRDGEPIPAKVRYPYVFELQVPEEEPEAAPAALEGRVVSAEDGTPIAGALLSLSGGDLTAASEITADADGAFSFQGLTAGEYVVRVLGEDFDELVQPKRWKQAKPPWSSTGCARSRCKTGYGAVARIRPPPREVTRRTINRTQLTRIPGTRGDALRAVELQPGVARPPFGAGALIVRGSSPGDSETQLEGLPLPLLYHFGGLTSVFNSQLLESVEFFPGNFSVRYGRRRGGIVEANVRDPATDGLHGMADINVIDTYALLEGRITDDLSFAIAGRRSYIDLVLGSALSEDDVSVVAAPVYYDYQGILNYRPNDAHQIRLMLFGSRDEFAVLFEDPPDDDPNFSGVSLSTMFHRAHLSWYARLSENLRQDVEIAFERTDVRLSAGRAVSFELYGYQTFGRSEWQATLSDNVTMVAGLDVRLFPGRVRYDGPGLIQDEGNPQSPMDADADRNRIELSTRFNQADVAAYVEANLWLDPVRIILGNRLDYYSLSGEYSQDPRLTALYTVNDQTTLKAGIGMFSQPPQPQETVVPLGNPDLKPTRTLHVSAGFDHNVNDAISFGVEGFYKHLWDRIVATDTGDPVVINGGTGRIFGLEIAGKIEPRGPFFGYVSYTLQRSERKDLDGQWRLFDFDQPHILTVAGVYQVGAGWELGATFRLVSGNPLTPILGGVQNEDTGTATPFFGRVNSDRNPTFHRLDVLVRKTWDFDLWKLAVYLDIQNAYNRQNPEGIVYDYRYQDSQTLPGLPIIPNLGVRGEF